MDMSQYLEIFIDESKDHLQLMDEILLELEKDASNLNHVNEIFRIAHTIKGMAGTMGFNRLANLTHEMENVLHLVRNGEIPVTTYIVDILFECFDSLGTYVTNLETTGMEGDLDSSALVSKLADIIKNKDSDVPTDEEKKEAAQEVGAVESKVVASMKDSFSIPTNDIEDLLSKASEDNMNAILIRIVIEEGCMLKAARSFIVFNTLDSFGEVIRSFPIAEEIEDEKFDKFFEVLFLTKLDDVTIKNEIMKISEIEEVITQVVEVEQEVVEVVEDKEVDLAKVEEVETKATKAPAAKAEPAKKKDTKATAKTSKTVRVEIGRLDNLMNLVSELIIVKTRLEDLDQSNKRQNMNEAIEYLERITTSLHDAVMKVRMVPVERTFNRFPRMVRDLSKDLGKNIKLYMSGEETEVDRTVIDEIGDPLIHLIRNSIDHGIEDPQTRLSNEKPEYGTVALRAYPDGNTVVIEVEDDGNGIDPERILAKALEKGVVTEAESDMLSENEIINLLFRPGFSTAEQVTDLSGRGVGLDVVKSKIEAINGTVEVRSKLGSGSKFIIRLPLTLAIIQALMVNLGDEKYAIPLNNIKEITTINASSINMVQNQEVVLYRNNTLPIIKLSEILDVEPTEEPSEEMITVIVKKGDLEAGLVVDSLIGQQEIVIKSLGKYMTGIRAIAGATILGNGSVALIVDPNQLF